MSGLGEHWPAVTIVAATLLMVWVLAGNHLPWRRK